MARAGGRTEDGSGAITPIRRSPVRLTQPAENSTRLLRTFGQDVVEALADVDRECLVDGGLARVRLCPAAAAQIARRAMAPLHAASGGFEFGRLRGLGAAALEGTRVYGGKMSEHRQRGNDSHA
jgi:hypothetical protein